MESVCLQIAVGQGEACNEKNVKCAVMVWICSWGEAGVDCGWGCVRNSESESAL